MTLTLTAREVLESDSIALGSLSEGHSTVYYHMSPKPRDVHPRTYIPAPLHHIGRSVSHSTLAFSIVLFRRGVYIGANIE